MKFSLKTGPEKYLGEDVAIEEVSGDHHVPVVFLTRKNSDFPLDIAHIAANISSLLNGNDTVPVRSESHTVFFHRQPDGFDLRFQRDGTANTEEGINVRIYESGAAPEIISFVKGKIVPGDGLSLASQLCDSVELLQTAGSEHTDRPGANFS